ncbi:coiled-coil domain-containing protein 17 [Hemiscyllium ocellatum]|uniref:coiled-coil domain-containing protein 17 n=1 Tax=Hemiscyllium ocellatum TaxID=170820 RepID=UPI002965FDCD|nr:coiled-coil domain-containing protein 17 [Hemiscyllium ocellatum]
MDVGNFHCDNCNMNFRSLTLLEKHKDKFCIGSYTEDSYLLTAKSRDCQPKAPGHGIHRLRINDPKETKTPYNMDKETKKGRFQQQQEEVNHLDINPLNERERKLLQEQQPEIGLSDGHTFRRLTEEFHKLRMSIEENLPTYRSWQGEHEVSPRVQRDWEHQERMREIAEMHGRQLADIQARNKDLEQQRDEIRQRLEELSSKEHFTAHIEQMLLELKAQEEKNQRALDALREQIELLQMESVVKQDSVNVVDHSPAQKKEDKMPLNFVTFASGDSLSTEIGALKMVYLQCGGNDPAILAQMHGLQAEAQLLEKSTRPPKEKKKKHESPHRSLDAELLAVELENQRLEEEILKLKLQRERRIPDDELEKEMQEMHREHTKKINDLQEEIEMLKSEANKLRTRKGLRSQHLHPPPPPPPPPIPPTHSTLNQHTQGSHMSHARPQTPMIAKHLLDPPDVLGPAPYDPAAGFVVFYDFLLGLGPTYRLIRLVTGLYNNGHEMGKPSALPAVYCEVGVGPHYLSEGLKGNFGILSAKQPVPRVRPSPGVSLVIELQAAGGFDPYGQEIQRLVSRGWAKIDIFDDHNQVISGRWKVPIRCLPVKPSLTTGQLNGIPQVGSAEVYLRVLNARDADVHSMATVDPHKSSMYQYPPLISSRSAPLAESLPPPQHLSYHHPAVQYLSHPPHVDLPPTEGYNDHHKVNQRNQCSYLVMSAFCWIQRTFMVLRAKQHHRTQQDSCRTPHP